MLGIRDQGLGIRAERLVALLLTYAFLSLIPSPWSLIPSAKAAMPITTDSRIKTFVYNENEVFNIITHYGYQSNVEFGPSEEIQTLSVGDRVGWQVVPAGRRLFIRAMEDNAHTNLTVVTNKRSYQFDLREAGGAALLPGEQLVYVVRFYYPDEPGMTPPPPVVAAADMAPPPPVAQAPAPLALVSPPAPVPAAMNYNYTFSGPAEKAPVKIYDDGTTTYFKFRPGMAPSGVAVLSASGQELAVNASAPAPDGTVAVGAIAGRFVIRSGDARVIVYNESMPGR